MDQIIRIGMDTSKHFFQLHGVDAAERPVLRRKLRRHEVLAFFAKQPPTVIGMETQHRSQSLSMPFGATATPGGSFSSFR